MDKTNIKENMEKMKRVAERNPPMLRSILESLPSLDRKVVVARLRDLDKGKQEGG